MLWESAALARQRLMAQAARLHEPHCVPEGVYVLPDEDDYLRWTGVLFVRSGPYATGIFRFSIQFSIASEHLALPTVFFPPILLHPIVEPASGRLNLLPYLALAQESHMPTDPDDPAFLCSLLTFLADCFSSHVLDNLCEQWILNERVYSYVPLGSTTDASYAQHPKF